MMVTANMPVLESKRMTADSCKMSQGYPHSSKMFYISQFMLVTNSEIVHYSMLDRMKLHCFLFVMYKKGNVITNNSQTLFIILSFSD